MEATNRNGYIKLIAIDIGHLESYIIDEKNTMSFDDIDAFKEKYNDRMNILLLAITMPSSYTMLYDDYAKIVGNIHPGDYIRDLVVKRQGEIIDKKYIISQNIVGIKCIDFREKTGK